MKLEKEYIDYLIKSKSIDGVSDLLDRYFQNDIEFEDLIVESNSVVNIYSYRSFVKSKIMDDLFKF